MNSRPLTSKQRELALLVATCNVVIYTSVRIKHLRYYKFLIRGETVDISGRIMNLRGKGFVMISNTNPPKITLTERGWDELERKPKIRKSE